MKEFAKWGKTGKGWFYGLKMHLLTDLNGNILAIKFTSGNINDRAVVMDLAQGLNGFFVADAGYHSAQLEHEFSHTGKRILLAKPLASMRKVATLFDAYLYSQRMRIEINFKILKQFYGLVTSLPRSPLGYFSNYLYALLAYIIA